MKNLFTIILCLYVMNIHAQIGIGTTSPTSTLDIRGSLSLNYRAFTSSTTAASTDNTLIFTGTTAATITLPDASTCTGRVYSIKNASTTSPLPLLTIATTLSQTIDASTTWLLNDSKEMITVVSDGANWKISGSGPVKTRNNYVLVQTATDFPAAVSGVITLVPNTLYEINGTITLTNKIDLNNNTIFGLDHVNDKLLYTPGIGELFTGSNGGTIKMLTLSATGVGSKLFNLDALNTNKNIILQSVLILSCYEVGVIKNFPGETFFENVMFFYNTNGITFQNDSNVNIINMFWDVSNSNIFEKYIGSFSFIRKVGGHTHPMAINTATAVDVSGVTSISQGEVKQVLFIGTGTYVTGTFSKQWEAESHGITTEKDDVATGNLYLITVAATSFSAINTPTKVLCTTTAVGLFRVSSPVSNRLQYTGTRNRRFAVIGSVSVTAQSANKYFSFYIYKNGVKLPESEQAMRLSTGVDKGSLTLSCTVQLSANDYIEIWAANTSDGTSMTVETLNLTIK